MVANNSHWIESVQCKWDEVKSKIVRQGSLEAPNKAKLRTILEGVTETGSLKVFFERVANQLVIRHVRKGTATQNTLTQNLGSANIHVLKWHAVIYV